MAQCKICGCQTWTKQRIHPTPDECVKAIDREFANWHERSKWLVERRAEIQRCDRIQAIQT